MKKYTAIMMTVVLLVGFIGCTSPTQPSAERDLQVASEKFDTIVYDMALRAKRAEIRRVISIIQESNDPKEREKAVVEMSDTYAEVEFLLIQAERAQGLMRSGREWVRAQRGVFSVLFEEYKESKARAEAKAKVEAQQKSQLQTTPLESTASSPIQ